MTVEYEILGIGAPILDQILFVDEDFLKQEVPGEKGGMELITKKQLDRIIEKSGKTPVLLSGGSAANTIKGLASLGRKCALTGKLGADKSGRFLSRLMRSLQVIPLYLQSPTPTGESLCLITPDHERTMRTFVGAAVEMTGLDLDPAWFDEVKLVHIEGYTLLNKDLTERAMKLAKEAGALVSFDLSSFEIAERFKERIVHLLSSYVDILFANEKEAAIFTKLEAEKGCSILKDICETVVVFLGEEGGFAARNGKTIRYPAFQANAIDTTGAGDLFASGFLHSYLAGASLAECAHQGSLTGSAAVQVLGTDIPIELWNMVKSGSPK